MDIEEFKKKNKPKRASSLKDFESKILELVNDRFSQKSICEYLKSNGVKTTQQNVSRFCKKISSNPKPISKKNNELKKETQEKESFNGFKLERKGKDLEIKAAPDWATQ